MVLGIVSSQPGCSLEDLSQILKARAGPTGHDFRFLAREAIATLVRWGLVEVYDGKRLALDEVERITEHDLLSNFKLRITPQAAEIESNLGLRLDGSPPSVFGLPKRKPDQQPFIFVVMPFAAEMTPVFETIKEVGASLDLKVERGDDAFTANVVMEDVWSSIYFARLVVADCTGRNPNVFYEIGLAHSIGKTTILLSRTIDDIPFDIRQRRVIISAATPAGREELAKKLEATIRFELKV